MIITEEMEDTMQQKKVKFAGHRKSGLSRIAGRCLGGDDHVTEKTRFPAEYFSFLLSKRDHIGRFIPLQIFTINLPDTAIADDKNR